MNHKGVYRTPHATPGSAKYFRQLNYFNDIMFKGASVKVTMTLCVGP